GALGVLAERLDGGDADHDDQRQHDRVFDRGRAVFPLQEVHDGLGHLLHHNLRFERVWVWVRVASAAAPDAAMFSDTLLKVLLAFWPSVWMAAIQTTMIRASITAYSTAVGPSSFLRKSTARAARVRNMSATTSGRI